MNYQYLKHPNGKVAYLKFGEGEQLLICLHGFSDKGSLFEVLAPSLSQKYTVYAIDFPFHGLTEWHKNHFDKHDVLSIFQLILDQENKQRLSLMGYSMGGRITQVILPKIIQKVDELYLIAPDGIQTKWLFSINQMPLLVRKILKKALNNPERFFKLLKWLYQQKIITKFLHNFTFHHLKTTERRDRLFNIWTSIYHLKTYPRRLKKLLRKSQLPTQLYFGSRDEIIPKKGGEWLANGLDNVTLNIIEEGHLLVDEKLDALDRKSVV